MVGSRDAKEWARAELDRPLIGDSLYTPFRGRDGEELDLDAYRALVRHCVEALDRRLLFVTSGNGEFWSLTVAERKRLLEATVETARTIAPDTIIQSCTSSTTTPGSISSPVPPHSCPTAAYCCSRGCAATHPFPSPKSTRRRAGRSLPRRCSKSAGVCH